MPTLTRAIAASLITAAIAGCAYPKASTYQEAHEQCHLVTKQLELDFDTEYYKRSTATPCAVGCEGEVLALVAIPTITLVVSGSVVLVGNTLHWMEKEGRCDDSTTHNLVNHFTSELTALGGILVNSVQNLGQLFTPHPGATPKP